MKKLRVGGNGIGFFGTAHVEALRRLGYIDVAAVADAGGGAEKAEALYVAHGYDDYREMIQKENLDAVQSVHQIILILKWQCMLWSMD